MAQTFEAGLFAGASTYVGDLNPYNTPGDLFVLPGPSLGAFGRYNHNPHFSLRLGLYHGNISGDPSNTSYDIGPGYDQPSFQTHLTEMSLLAEFNFLPYVAGDPDSRFTPYLFGGMGAFFFEHASRESGDGKTIAWSRSNIFGAGFKLHLSKKFSGSIDWGMRSTNTDKLDGIYTYMNPGNNADVLISGGNPKKNDWYSFTGLSIVYRIKDRSRAICPY